MAVLQIILEVLVAFFAVIGIYSLWRLCCGRLFGSERMLLALEILDPQEAAGTEMLIRDAMTHILWLRSGQITVLTTREIARDDAFRAVLKRYGVACRIVDAGETENGQMKL